jgi:hypothetical protein
LIISLFTSAVLFTTLLAAEPAKNGAPRSNLPDAAVLKALCPAKTACTVLDKRVAGKAAGGDGLVFAGVEEKPKAKGKQQEPEDGDEPCLPAPYGLLHVQSGRVVSVEPIVTLREGDCSYGVRGGGETITFDGKTATYTMEGGSNWAWSESKTWELRPSVRQILEDSTGWWTVSSNRSHTIRDLRRARTTVDWFVPNCDEHGEPSEVNEENDGAKPGDANYAYLEIPRLDAAAKLDWKSAAFPTEALVVTSQKNDGFITFGKPGTARDARFRVIALSGRELLVEVADPQISEQAKNWINDDHLELWTGPALIDYYTHCIVRDPAGQDSEFAKRVGVAQQWGIRTADGTIFRGMGKPQSDPKVERVEVDSLDWGHVVRFRIAFAKDLESVTVVYSDSDHGKRQLRMLATSRIKLRDAFTLGVLAPAGGREK